jgi:sodium transport system permease protein
VALLYFYVGRGLQMGRGEQGILLSQWLLLALPAVLFALLGPYNVKRTLALRAPPVRALVAAVLIILGGIPFGWMIGWLQSFVLPIPEEFLNALQQLVSAGDTRRFLWLLLLVAVTPAICEELVFRGVLLQGLGREMPMARAIAVSALIFGAFHLSTETVIRFLPTAWLGALLGYVVWHTRSILAAMLMHFLNNAVVVAAVSIPAIRDRFADPQSPPPWVLVAAAPVLLVVGLRLLPKRAEVADAPTAGLPPRDAPDGAPTVHSR